ncbi:MAG TPA: hypothetical protein DDW42_04980 [Desulfobacteraceae bacterium]|nr:hypothetical protein [Desulfobacteraceae bacterium]
MIKNHPILQEFEKELIAKQRVDMEKNLKLMDAMYDEAAALGIFPLKDPLQGLDVDIKIARVINRV